MPVANQIIPGQGGLQAFLILIAFVSVPMLLLPKPLLLKRQHEMRQSRPHNHIEEDDAPHGGHGGHGGHGDTFEFGEVCGRTPPHPKLRRAGARAQRRGCRGRG